MNVSLLARRTTTGLALSTLIVAGLVAAPVHAAGDLVVTTTADSGPGSLREALASAAASAEDDHISFDPTVTGTILLTSGQLETSVGAGSGNLVLEGPGADVLAIDADRASRVLDVSGSGDGPRPVVDVSGLTITDGYVGDGDAWQSAGPFTDDGGGIRVLGADVRLDSVLVSGSQADVNGGGVLAPDGHLAVIGSTISGNRVGSSTHVLEGVVNEGYGGGLSAREVLLVDSRVTGNTALADGGGLDALSLSATGSTIDHNTAGERGGGLRVGGTDGEAATLTSSTVSDNVADHAGGGVYVPRGGRVELTSSTLAGNAADVGGGVATDSALTLRSSIVAMNPGGDLEGEGTAALTRSLLQRPGDFAVEGDGASVLGQDPLLSELADHGGPTPTMLPAPNSPAVDVGVDVGATDQRGLPRRVGEGADIGAVELTEVEQAALPGVRSVTAPVVAGTARVGETLRTDGGSWDPEAELSYQWLRDGAPLPGATGRSYVVTPADFVSTPYLTDGHRLSVRVTATAPGRRSATRASDVTAYTTRGRMRVERPATVSGRTLVGHVLRARPRSAGVSPVPSSVRIGWFLDDELVRRAYGEPQLQLTPRMRGQRVKVVFWYAAHGYRGLKQVVRTDRPVH